MTAYVPHKHNPWEMSAEELEATFIGREAILDRLLEAAREQSQAGAIRHYLLLGPRGVGSTSLLLFLRHRLRKDPELSARWLCVHLREEEFYVYTLRDLLAMAVESLGADENVAEAKAILDEAQAERDDERSQAILLAGLRRICATRGQRILLLVDNLDQFLRTLPRRDDAETFERGLMNLLGAERFLMIVGTTKRPFDEFASDEQAFLGLFCPVPVGNLTDDEVDALLMARARFDDNRDFLRGYERHKASVRAITFLAGGNPRILLMLYEALSQARILPVAQALRQTVDPLTPLFKCILEAMGRQQCKTLDAVMRLGGAGSPTDIAATARLRLNVVTTMLGRLKAAGFLASEGEGKGRPATYRVRDQMLRAWYQMRCLRPNCRRLDLLAGLLRAWFASAERAWAVELAGTPAEERARALFDKAGAELAQGNTQGAIEDYALCVESCASEEAVHRGLRGLVRALGTEGRGDEALQLVSRLENLEPEDAAEEDRLAARVGLFGEVARAISLDAAGVALAGMVDTEDAGMRERLGLLAPALELARTGDEAVLAKLPEAEREAAKRIAASIQERAARSED